MIHLDVGKARNTITRIVEYDKRYVSRKNDKANLVLERLVDTLYKCKTFEQLDTLLTLAEQALSEMEVRGQRIPPEAYTCLRDCHIEVCKIKRHLLSRHRMSIFDNPDDVYRIH